MMCTALPLKPLVKHETIQVKPWSNTDLHHGAREHAHAVVWQQLLKGVWVLVQGGQHRVAANLRLFWQCMQAHTCEGAGSQAQPHECHPTG